MKVLFVGIAAAFALFGALEILGQPTFYDKLLAVPLLNLSVQALDRIAGSESVQRWTAATFGRYRTALQENSVHMAFWVVLFAAMMMVMLATGIDQVTAFSAIAASLNNLGPGLGAVAENYAGISPAGKWVLCFSMLLGRLELFTLLVLFSRSFWRS